MTQGQPSDVWATYYAARTHREILARPIPRATALARWLTALSTPDGGLTWQPGHGAPDVRAVYYAVQAAHALPSPDHLEWDQGRIVGWLQSRQARIGGFTFVDGDAPCLWATFRAVRALDRLSARPARGHDVVRWIQNRRLPGGGFARWADYPHADVWAGFSAVGALSTLGHPLDPIAAEELASFLLGCRLPAGGFTYRHPDHAGDALATAAALLLERWSSDASGRLARWLRAAHLPYEGGVMYMPGRGAEVRCTLWAISALRHARRRQLDADQLTAWFQHIRNPDGGYGYWHGRGSDLVATVSVIEALDQLDRPGSQEAAETTAGFIRRCRTAEGFGFVPGQEVTAASTAQGIRALALLDRPLPATEAEQLLARYSSRLGGYGQHPRQPPDLVSTYQVVRTQQVVGLPVDRAALSRFVARIQLPDGETAWSVLGSSGGVLARCLGHHLDHAAQTDHRLPALNL
jgi:prenyltransferase beta subunit